jgi:hypothetical protein
MNIRPHLFPTFEVTQKSMKSMRYGNRLKPSDNRPHVSAPFMGDAGNRGGLSMKKMKTFITNCQMIEDLKLLHKIGHNMHAY